MKLSAIIRWAIKLLRNIFMGYETILLLILKNFCVAVKVCDIHLLNEALGAYLHNFQHQKHTRHRANRITESLLLHNSTVIALSCIWYCIGLIFCELLIRLPVCNSNRAFAKMIYMQH